MLLAEGFSIQLVHDPTEKGTFRQEHGFVAIQTLDGVELVRDAGFQHNVNFHDRESKIPELVTAVISNLKA